MSSEFGKGKTATSPEMILQRIMYIINRDVMEIKSGRKIRNANGKEIPEPIRTWKQLSAEEANKLVRYAATLKDMTARTAKEKAEAKKEIQGLPSDELLARYKELENE